MRSERSLGLRYCSGLGAGKLDGVLCHSGGTAAFISLEEIRLVFCALSIIFDSKILKKNCSVCIEFFACPIIFTTRMLTLVKVSRKYLNVLCVN
jgi:hypothetical protein